MRTLLILSVIAFMLAACIPATPEETIATELLTDIPPDATEAPVTTEGQREIQIPTTDGKLVTPTEPVDDSVKIILWTTESELDGAFQYIHSLADAYTVMHPKVTFEVVSKQPEILREDFQHPDQATALPDLLWTVNDHIAPFAAAQLIRPVDDLFDLSGFVDSALEAVKLGGQTWGVPITNGNHLMLYYNKNLVPKPPTNTDELIEFAKRITDSTADIYGLVFDQTSPLLIVPWLGGFGGAVFAGDGITPTLNSPEMVATLLFLHDLKFFEGILPAESDSIISDGLFKEGRAGMIINGDWMLDTYKDAFGDKLGVAPIPQLVASGRWPTPYTYGNFLMLPSGLKGKQLEVAKDFIEFSTNTENQLDMVTKLARLPANKKALENDLIAADPILAGSAQQMVFGTPLPTVPEMRCVEDSIKQEMQAVLADRKTPEEAAAAMQSTAESCIAASD